MSGVMAHEDALDGAQLSSVVTDQLADFARLWGIKGEVKTACEALEKARKQASLSELPDADFAMLQPHKGETVRKYAAFDKESTYDSAVAFYDNRHRYPLAWRKQAASELIQRAEKHQTVIPEYVNDYLHKAAGFAVPTQASIEEALVQRLNLRDGEPTQKLASALDAIAGNSMLRYDSELVTEFLYAMDRHDRETKIASHYGVDLQLPEEMLEWSLPKLAKFAGISNRIVRLTNGYEVDVTEISHDTLESVADGMSRMSHEKLAAVLPTLPRPDADLLVHLLPKHAAVASPANTLTDDNFSAQMAAPAPAAPVAPKAPVAPVAPKAPINQGITVATGDQARQIANNVRINEARPLPPGAAAANQQYAQQQAQRLGMDGTHGPLR